MCFEMRKFSRQFRDRRVAASSQPRLFGEAFRFPRLFGESERQGRSTCYAAGFSLTEVLVATVLSGVVLAGVFSAFSYASRATRAGCYQVQFTSMARLASQKLGRYIEAGKAVGLASNGLDIMTINLKCARIVFDDGDGDISSVADNCLVYDPDISVTGDEKVVCTHVSPIAGEAMFSIIPSSPSTAKLCFHVGDGTDVKDAAFSGTGSGYQGVEVRMSSTPRNLQRWYD